MRQIEDIFHAACELAPAEREVDLSKVCGSVGALSWLGSDGDWQCAGDRPLTEIKMEM